MPSRSVTVAPLRTPSDTLFEEFYQGSGERAISTTMAWQKGRRIEVARFPWAASGRATTVDRNDGVTKLLLEPETGRVLGVGLAGSGAGELIAEGVLAVEMAALASDLALSIHPHPTLSETLMEAAEAFFGQSTHIYRPPRHRSGA